MFKKRKLAGGSRKKIEEPEPELPGSADAHFSVAGSGREKPHSESEQSNADPVVIGSSVKGPTQHHNSPVASAKNPESQPPRPDPPLRKPAPTIITDFQPNVCTQYYKNGYCGFGDTCKFLHIRDLHPSKLKRKESVSVEEEHDPTICRLCTKELSEPVKTKCGHRFCMKCFTNHTKTSSKCPICKLETNSAVSIERV